jgi:hypothetical protein
MERIPLSSDAFHLGYPPASTRNATRRAPPDGWKIRGRRHVLSSAAPDHGEGVKTMKRRPKRILRGAVLAFAVAAFAVPTAQAKPGPLNLGPNAAVQSAAYAPQQLHALQLWSQGMNERYGITGHKTTTVSSTAPPLLASSSNGFSWGDAFIGAATTLATALVLAFAVIAARRTRQHPVRV